MPAWRRSLSRPGSGWRQGLRPPASSTCAAASGFDRPGKTAFTDEDCSTAAPAALYGCGTGGDGAPFRSAGTFGTVPALEFGLGYATGTVRFEATVGYRPDFAFRGRANFLAPERRQSVSAKLSSVSGMLAGYVDLAGLGLPTPGPFAPFVGAGIGAAHTRIGKTTMTFPTTTTTVPGGSRTGLAWMATAGVAVALNERVSLDMAWPLHGPRRRPHEPGARPSGLARREPGAAAAGPRAHEGAAQGPRRPAVAALRFLRAPQLRPV